MTTEQRINKEYFEWMYRLVKQRGASYRSLLRRLHEQEFYYSIPLDGNRESDGINLRYRFGYEKGYSDRIVGTCLDCRPCSVLEMMVALSFRCEETIMCDPEAGDRMRTWFWEMIDSLGLLDMADNTYDESYVDSVIERFLERDYRPNGEGGLFTLRHPRRDLRRVEIWYQMCWYLNEQE